MRISGGKYKGRKISVSKGQDIRPASDKVRQAVFNSLLSRIDLTDIHVLDVFCGSGSYGLEALSRGAAFCTFVDKDTRSVKGNIAELGLGEHAQIIQSDVLKLKQYACLSNNKLNPALLFCDPPYRRDLLLPAMQHLKEVEWLKPETLCVLECEKEFEIDGDTRSYGEVQIVYRNGHS